MDLKSIAEEKKDQLVNNSSDELAIENNVTQNDSPSEDDDVFIIGPLNNAEDVPSDLINPGANLSITDEDLRAIMPDLTDEVFVIHSVTLRKKVEEHRKKLIMHGFTIEEANEATMNMLRKNGKEINDNFLIENPNLGIITINKCDVDKLELTQEEHEKLSKTKSLRLVLVEDRELKNIEIEKIDKKSKSIYLKSIEGALSKYSVPLPLTGDFITFKGAQLIQLISAVKNEDESLSDNISRKASLIYDRLFQGGIINKYNENNIVMSYNDFINIFKFNDIELAIYGILVASSPEDMETPLTCGACKHQFNQKFNLKTIFSAEKVSDKFKEIFDGILSNKNNIDELQKYHDAANKVDRFMSPFSKNIYDISYPTIGKAIQVYNHIDADDDTMIYLSVLALFLHEVFIYNEKNDSYIQIESDEIPLMLEVLQEFAQEDIDIISSQMKEMMYQPEFIIKSQCPHCGNNMSNTVNIDYLVFLRAQDSFTEIQS